MPKKKKEINIRSSAAEYLTYVASVGDNADSIELRYEDENIWITQKMMATLYDVEVNTINYHIKKVFKDSELQEDSVIRKFRITAEDGKNYNTNHYSLEMIIAVGFKVNSERAVQFRKWVNQIAIDYDRTSAATKRFYATVQNRIHFAVHGRTAAELIVERANSTKEHMGLTTWSDAPSGKIKKTDVTVAKNYLSEFEMSQLERLVTAYLDFAESMTLRHIPLTMQDWETRLNGFIEMFEYGILKDAGKISAEIAKLHAETEFEKYRIIQDKPHIQR